MARLNDSSNMIGARIRHLRNVESPKERYRLNVYRSKVNAVDLKMMILTGIALGAVFIAGLQSWFDWNKAAREVPVVVAAPTMSPANDPYFEARVDRRILDRQAGPPPPRAAPPGEAGPAR
jgi:hypothetical protein